MRRKHGWTPDYQLRRWMLLGGLIGIPLGLLTANLAWIGGQIGRLLP